MSAKIVQLNEEIIKGEIKGLVRSSVEETLNGLLEQEAQQLTNAAKHERGQDRQGYRSGRYSRNLTTSSGEVELRSPKLKGVSFEAAIIERCKNVSLQRIIPYPVFSTTGYSDTVIFLWEAKTRNGVRSEVVMKYIGGAMAFEETDKEIPRV